jgi:hypothetical protein
MTFGTHRNFRTETLTFKVVGVLRDVPRYPREASLREVYGCAQLHVPEAEDPGPKGVITVGMTFQHAYECDAECFQFAENSFGPRSSP